MNTSHREKSNERHIKERGAAEEEERMKKNKKNKKEEGTSAIGGIVAAAVVAATIVVMISLSAVVNWFLLSIAQQQAQEESHSHHYSVQSQGSSQSHSLYLHCSGTGAPVVVFESDVAQGHAAWGSVQEIVSQFTRACSYDRAGVAWSGEKVAGANSAEEMVLELHDLLLQGGETGPFILVGHGFGGFLSQLFAKNFPQQVVGMLLVDPVTEVLLDIDHGYYFQEVHSSLKNELLGYSALLGFNRIAMLMDVFPNRKFAARLPPRERYIVETEWNKKSHWTHLTRESDVLIQSLEEFRRQKRTFVVNNSTVCVIFTPVDQTFDKRTKSWSQNQQILVQKLPAENIIRLPVEDNIADNEVANEIADAIRRLFASSREEDFTHWV